MESFVSNPQEVGSILEGYRPRLRAMVKLRLDARLRARVDPSDVIQEAFLEVTERLPEYLAKREVPFFIWVRFLAGQKLGEIHRRHLGRRIRDVRRERPPLPWGVPEASSIAIATAFVDRGPSPSQVAMRNEKVFRLRRAIEELKEMDREVVVLRHFEGLSNLEVSQVLGISKPGASLRYVRAMQRLGALLLSWTSGSGVDPYS